MSEAKGNPWSVEATFKPDGSVDSKGAYRVSYDGPKAEPDADGWETYQVGLQPKDFDDARERKARKDAAYEESLKPKYDAVSFDDMVAIEKGLRDLELQPVFTKILQDAVTEKLGAKVTLDRFGRLSGNRHVSVLSVGDMNVDEAKKLFTSIGMRMPEFSAAQMVTEGTETPDKNSRPLYHHEIAHTQGRYYGEAGNHVWVRTDSLIAALGIDPETLKPEALKKQAHLVYEGSAADIATSATKKLMAKLTPQGRANGRDEGGKPLTDDGIRER